MKNYSRNGVPYKNIIENRDILSLHALLNYYMNLKCFFLTDQRVHDPHVELW